MINLKNIFKKESKKEEKKKGLYWERPTRTFNRFFEHIKTIGFNPETVIDVGAARGTPALYDSFPDAYHIMIEPLDEFEEKLIKLLEKINGEYHICAVMEKAEEDSSIFVTKELFGSSMMHRIKDDADERLKKVKVRTLDDVLSGVQLAGPILLKTDCQGGDLSVIKGGLDTVDQCEVIIMEVSLFKFWGEHHPDFHEIISYMHTIGFVVYDILDGLFRPYDSALGQMDLVFVKEKSVFRQSNLWIEP
jgi:FkbM family methyltransferase